MTSETTSESLINNTRVNLVKTFGTNYNKYVTLMKKWFTKEITKDEYDEELRQFLTQSQIRFHNKFILSLLSKCSSISSPSISVSKSDVEPKAKKIKLEEIDKTIQCTLRRADPHEHLREVNPKTLQEELIAKGVLSFLPDHDSIFARIMLHAWEHDLEGVEEDVCNLVIEATYTFARNILTAIISRRSGFKIREKRFVHAHGLPVPNPWTRNILKHDLSNRCEATEIVDNEYVHVPKMKPTIAEIEENLALGLALSSENTTTRRNTPISIDDVIDALRVHPSIIPRYLMYSVNMEKLLLARHHLSHQEIETK